MRSRPKPSRSNDLVAAFAAGNPGVVVSAPIGQGYGAIVLAADAASRQNLGFMHRFGSGIVAVSLLEQRLTELNLPLMVDLSRHVDRPFFTISVDAAEGVTTGISASDRARTIQVLVDPSSSPDDLNRPGHVYPIQYRKGRCGMNQHADIALDLARQVGRYPGGVATVILNSNGTLAGPLESRRFAEAHDLPYGDFVA